MAGRGYFSLLKWVCRALDHDDAACPSGDRHVPGARGRVLGGGKSYKGFSLGAVTSTLIAAVIIGQLGIPISPDVKAVFFLIFLFAVGYGVGPQFVRGIAKDGLPQALFSVVMCLLCLGSAYLAARLAGYDAGSAAGLFAGSQTLSASMGLATDAINRTGLPPDQTKAAERDPGRLRRHLHLRHGWLRSDLGRAWAAPASHRLGGRMQSL